MFTAIVMADLCLLCRGPRISANQIRGFLRVKHCLAGSAASKVLGLQSLGDFLTFLREMKCRTTTGCYVVATGITDSGEDLGRRIIMPHPVATDIRSQIPRTDHYFVAYHQAREERGTRELQDAKRDQNDLVDC